MFRSLLSVLCALILATIAVAPAAAAVVPASQPRLSDVRWQDEWTGEGEEDGPGEAPPVEVVIPEVVIPEVVIPEPVIPEPDEWATEGIAAEEPVEVWVPEDGVAEEPVAVEPPLEETGEQAPAEDEFAAFSMPGMSPNNLTSSVLGDIDAFWAGELAARGRDYYAAATVPVTEPTTSSCGTFGPYDNPAAYCPLDDTVYYSIPMSQDITSSVGDFAWITVLAHEWGHHVQVVLGLTPDQSIERELQADCMAGAYALRAQQQGFLQEGDVSEGVVMAMLSGDPAGIEETAAGAHGSSDDRVTSFMKGYFNGAAACIAF